MRCDSRRLGFTKERGVACVACVRVPALLLCCCCCCCCTKRKGRTIAGSYPLLVGLEEFCYWHMVGWKPAPLRCSCERSWRFVLFCFVFWVFLLRFCFVLVSFSFSYCFALFFTVVCLVSTSTVFFPPTDCLADGNSLLLFYRSKSRRDIGKAGRQAGRRAGPGPPGTSTCPSSVLVFPDNITLHVFFGRVYVMLCAMLRRPINGGGGARL